MPPSTKLLSFLAGILVLSLIALPTPTSGFDRIPAVAPQSRHLLAQIAAADVLDEDAPLDDTAQTTPSASGTPSSYQLVLEPSEAALRASKASPIESMQFADAEAGVRPETSSPPPPAHWTYSSPKTGPYNWGNLDVQYAMCAAGHRQSPVDIKLVESARATVNGVTSSVGVAHADTTLKHLLFNYATSNVSLVRREVNLTSSAGGDGIDDVLNNGHTIQVSYETGSSVVIGDGRRFDLAQFHFHSPSEHTLDGRRFDMEAHLVHRGEDGSLVVVAVWLEVPRGVVAALRRLRGRYSSLDHLSDAEDEDIKPQVRELMHEGANPFLDALNWHAMPRDPSGRVAPAVAQLNIFDALPIDQDYFTYAGSLTTPPCSEIVTWYVLKQPVTVSVAQRNAFRDIFGDNARPTQLLHGRNITMTPGGDAGGRRAADGAGVSHDVFLGLVGALVVLSLLFFFAMLFICTRTQHRLAGGERSLTTDSDLLSPPSRHQPQLSHSPLRPHAEPYMTLHPLEDEMEHGDRHRAGDERAALLNGHALQSYSSTGL